MISICPSCKNHEWDKEVKGDQKQIVHCPKCGHEWSSTGLPLYIITGCSGVGKTTVAMELLHRDKEFIILDADYFQFMPSATSEDWAAHIERMQDISADIMQNGRPVVWTQAGCIDRLYDTYNSRFFSDIKCLALTCDPKELRRRMIEGRNITSEEWLISSNEYNNYFTTHDRIGEVKYEKLDITLMSIEEIADYVTQWVVRYDTKTLAKHETVHK